MLGIVTNLFVKNENIIMPFWLKKIEFGLQVFCSKWKKAFKCSHVMAHTVQLMHDAYGPVTLFYYHLNWQLIAIKEFWLIDCLSTYQLLWVILYMLHNFWIIMLFLQVMPHSIPQNKISFCHLPSPYIV